MKELETLLNALIAKGWKPFGKKYTHLNYDPKRKYRHIMFGGVDLAVFSYSLRQLVSLESSLWQFVCENNMVYSSSFIEWQKWGKQGAVLGLGSIWHQYRLLESALVPEEELAQFLVDNIIVEGMMN